MREHLEARHEGPPVDLIRRARARAQHRMPVERPDLHGAGGDDAPVEGLVRVRVRVDETRHDDAIARIDDAIALAGAQPAADAGDATVDDVDVGVRERWRVGGGDDERVPNQQSAHAVPLTLRGWPPRGTSHHCPGGSSPGNTRP